MDRSRRIKEDSLKMQVHNLASENELTRLENDAYKNILN